MRPGEFLTAAQRTRRLYEAVSAPVCEALSLTQTELDVVGFLSNNPAFDTAQDIVEIRLLPKANVSQAVKALIRKGLLSQRRDREDRRWVHLSLTDAGKDAAARIEVSRQQLSSVLLDGFSEEEKALYRALSLRMSENAARYLREECENHGGK